MKKAGKHEKTELGQDQFRSYFPAFLIFYKLLRFLGGKTLRHGVISLATGKRRYKISLLQALHGKTE
jgi:hypothetical protein